MGTTFGVDIDNEFKRAVIELRDNIFVEMKIPELTEWLNRLLWRYFPKWCEKQIKEKE